MRPRAAGKKRPAHSGGPSKGPQAKKFKKGQGKPKRQGSTTKRSSNEGSERRQGSSGFNSKQKPSWKKQEPGKDVKKPADTDRNGTSATKSPSRDDSSLKRGAMLFKRNKPLAEKKVLNKKEKKKLRRSQQENYPIIESSKGKWETLRRHDCEKEDKSKIISDLVKATKGHIIELISKHDTVRVVQSMLQYGTPQQRALLFGEIRDSIKDLVKQKYAKHLVLKVLKYGTASQRAAVMSSFHGSVCKLVRHSVAAPVLETAYNDYATAPQRAALHLEFYGSQYAHFKPQDLVSLSSVLQTSSSIQKKSVVAYIRSQLMPIVDKAALKHSIVHHVLYEYLTHVDDQGRSEMIELVRERLVEIVHTKDGARATMLCLWHGSAKDRKAIIKSFKGFVKKICFEENGYLVLLALFDCVDDTVLVRKAIVTEILSDLEEISCHQNGCRLLLYLLSPRSPDHFKKSFLALLEPGDNNTHSKKTLEARHCDILTSISSEFISFTESKVQDWIRDKHFCHLLIEVIFNCKGDVSTIVQSIYTLLSEDFSEDDHIVSDPVGHFTVKRILMRESRNFESAKSGSSAGDDSSLSEMILRGLKPAVLRKWSTTNRGSFVLCSLVLSKLPGISDGIAKVLKPLLPDLASKGQLKGQEALVNDLKRLSQ